MVDVRIVDARPEPKPETQSAVDRLVARAMQQSDQPAPNQRPRDPEY